MEPEQKIAELLKPRSEGGIYTDVALVNALGHAESGKLSFHSCCCFAGIPSAVHELRGKVVYGAESLDDLYREGHDAPRVPGHLWLAASMAYLRLGATEEERRAKLIPLIKAEISRRESSRSQTEEESEMVMV